MKQFLIVYPVITVTNGILSFMSWHFYFWYAMLIPGMYTNIYIVSICTNMYTLTNAY